MKRFNKYITTAATLVLFVPLIAFSQPKLVLPLGESMDFGEIYGNTPIHRTLVVKNTGTDTLVVSHVSAQCGCTVAIASHDHIAPGDSGSISLSFDPKRFSGPVQKAISFDSNDPDHKHLHITFGVNIIKVIESDPEYLTIPDARVDSSVTVNYVVRNLSDEPIHLFGITSTSNLITVDAPKKILAPKEEMTVECTFHPKQRGIFRADINIKTDHPKVPDLSTRVFALVKGK